MSIWKRQNSESLAVRRAAEQGHVSAQYLLGTMYLKGEGVQRDNIEAYAWLNVAMASGFGVMDGMSYIEGMWLLSDLESNMSPADLTKAKKRGFLYLSKYGSHI